MKLDYLGLTNILDLISCPTKKKKKKKNNKIKQL